MNISAPISCRRTFAIVSHPDAGKTTLTEKLLLYGGAIHLAGSVTARKKERATTSDWMELERQRGISVSSTVLNFEYAGNHVTILDTPGHKDFSEDTYRVLTAVDSVIMVIDAAKGIEPQTRKLFEVCRLRHIPVFTFVNKMDRPARDTLEILDEIETVLKITAYAMNWPLGSGTDFRGVWDRRTRLAHFFERTPGGAYIPPVSTHGFDDPAVMDRISTTLYGKIAEEIETVEHAGAQFDHGEVLAGRMTPIFFGSAANNFGVQQLLEGFVSLAPAPMPRTSAGKHVPPAHPLFSGFIFKIQANMDPRHRDRMAFVRIVSGRFTKNMPVVHKPSGKRIRLSNFNNIFGRERTSTEDAYAGDVVGIVGGDLFAIGDTLTEDPEIVYNEIPVFPPECFSYLHNPLPSNYKRFEDGLAQLQHEGLVRIFELPTWQKKVALLGAVGPLQFEIVQYRLNVEYGAPSRLEAAPWQFVKWLPGEVDTEKLQLARGVQAALDAQRRKVLLFPDEWSVRYFLKNNPGIVLYEVPGETESILRGA